MKQYKVLKPNDIQKRIKKKVDEVNEMFGFSEDDAMALLRNYNWNKKSLEDKWFDEDQDKLQVDLGIKYDTNIVKKYPEVNDSRADKNGNMCMVMFCDFEDPK